MGDVVCIITHRHPDHFWPTLYNGTGWHLIAPEEVTENLVRPRVVPLQDAIKFKDMIVEPFRTPHGDTEHYSYLITWHGTRMYITGDTETTEHLLRMENLDVLFVTPWLLDSLARNKQVPDARKIIVHHHTENQRIDLYLDCIVPEQGFDLRIRIDQMGGRR